MKSDLVRESYNKVAENYSSNRNQFSNDKYLEQLVSNLQPGSTILDLGCSSGVPVDKFLLDRGFKVIGIDISDKQIELAQKNLTHAKFKLKICRI